MTILVVDDDRVICNVVAMKLETEGFRVFSANSGAEALARWQSHGGQIDLLITDMRMPWIDGPLSAKCLTTDDPRLTVLFISGEGDASELGEFKNFRFWRSRSALRHPWLKSTGC